MCDCIDIEIGSYDNQVELTPPPFTHGTKTICVDSCLATEIIKLWEAGVMTTGCCCGHNKLPPYIGVIESDIPKMKQMGYEVQFNPMRPGDEDGFKPKSV